MSKVKPDWRSLLNSEAEARDELDRLAHDGRPSGKQVLFWWKCVEDLLFAYAIAVAQGERPEPPPVELATVLSGLAGYLAVGQIPDPIAQAVTEGRRSPGPTERRHIGWAVAYRHACRPEGITHNGEIIRIGDKSPIKTLAALFEVDPNTIRTWVRTYEPTFMGVNNVNSDIIKKRTWTAGDSYRHAGRGHRAIGRRSGLNRCPLKG